MEEIPQDKVKSIYPFEKALAFKNNALNPTHPSHTGPATEVVSTRHSAAAIMRSA